MDAAQFQSRARSLSRSRPTTPLRPPSRTSTTHNPANAQNQSSSSSSAPTSTALDTHEPLFAELADSMADLEANFMHLQLMHESLARFGESFASFLYGLNVRAFCVDFPEAPVAESFERWREKNQMGAVGAGGKGVGGDGETTFMTTDASLVEQGSTTVSSKATMMTTPKRAPAPATPGWTANSTRTTGSGAGGYGRRGAGGRGGIRGGRGSGLARPRGRGIR